MSAIAEQIFAQLHQTQINLIQTPNKTTVRQYVIQLEEICARAGPDLAPSRPSLEFFLVPLVSALKRLNSWTTEQQRPNDWCDLNESLLGGVRLLVDTFPVLLDVDDRFADMINACSIVLSRLASASEASDELLSVCFGLLGRLFESASGGVFDRFVRASNLTTIGLLVAKSLDVVVESTSTQVRLDALNAVLRRLLERADELSTRVGVLFASFLPGVCIKLVQKFLLSQNLKLLNHKLVCSSLDVLNLLVARVFDDALLDEAEFRRSLDDSMSCLVPVSAAAAGLIVNRLENKTWMVESSEKLFYLVDRLLDSLVTHDNPSVKLTLVRFCSNVSQRCYFSLNVYLDRLLKVLVTYAVDCEPNEDETTSNSVASEARMAIENLEHKVIVFKSIFYTVVFQKFEL